MAQTKTITTYKVSAFDAKAAAEGGLCVMVASTYNLPQGGAFIDTTATGNSDIIKGTGICRCVNPDKFLLTVDSIVYTFNSEGKAANLNSVGMKLLMGEVTETLTTAGARVTRGSGASAHAYDITSLSARDEFAIQALRGLLRTIEDPASLSDTEKRYYCDVAYQWAANMMQSAAYTRQNAVNPASTSVPDVEGIVGALNTVSTAINSISTNSSSSSSSSGSTDVRGTVNIGNSGLGRNAQNPFYVSFRGDYLPLTGGTLTGDLRLKPAESSYGLKLLFGNGEYCYLQEDTDDHLHIYASNGITLNGDGIVIDALGTSVNINDDVYFKPGTTIYLKEVDNNNITRDREVATKKWVGDNYASINSVITKTNNSTSLLKANGNTIALTNFMQGDRIKELCEMLNRCFEQANVDIVVGYKKPTHDTFALLPAASASGIHRIGTGVTYVTTNAAAAYIGYVEGTFGSGSAGITNPLIIIISGVIQLLGPSADGSSLYYFDQGNIKTTNSDWNMSTFVRPILTSAVTKLSKIGIDVQNSNSTLVLGSGMSTATVSYYIPEFL